MLAAKETTMRRSLLPVIVWLGVGCGSSSAQQDASNPPDGTADAPEAAANFSFFISSAGNPNGGDFRADPSDSDGLAGADEFCRAKAVAAVPSAASKAWAAYLSTDTVNARDRIGMGPWYNHNGVMIAADVNALHTPASNMINKTTGLDEKGNPVPGREETPNQHDIVTGSTAQGMSSGSNCNNWTSADPTAATATVGHFDRKGVQGNIDPMSWVEAHASRGCSADMFVPTGGRGSIYCFGIDIPFVRPPGG
jgi:hypothetical protein